MQVNADLQAIIFKMQSMLAVRRNKSMNSKGMGKMLDCKLQQEQQNTMNNVFKTLCASQAAWSSKESEQKPYSASKMRKQHNTMINVMYMLVCKLSKARKQYSSIVAVVKAVAKVFIYKKLHVRTETLCILLGKDKNKVAWKQPFFV